MSKIKVDEVQADFETLRLNGTSNVQIKPPIDQPANYEKDGTLELTTRTGDSIKVIAPTHDDGREYTLILPQSIVKVGDLIKVESVNNTDDGQLAFAPPGVSTQTNLNASNITSGTLSADRFATDPDQAAFTFIEKKTIGSSPVPSIFLDRFEDDSLYLLIAKTMVFVDATTLEDANTYPKLQLLDVNGNKQNHITFVDNFGPNDQSDQEPDTDELTLQAHASGPGERSMGFTSLISTKAGETYVQTRGIQPGKNRRKHEGYGSFNSSGSTQRIHGIKILPHATNTWIKDCQLLLYKYLKN